MSGPIPEHVVLSLMGEAKGGMTPAVEAVAELLISLGYVDTAIELRRRYDDQGEGGGCDCC